MSTNSQKKTGGNSFVTFEQLVSEMVRYQYNNWHYINPSEMFIEDQYNWEREEFDEHA